MHIATHAMSDQTTFSHTPESSGAIAQLRDELERIGHVISHDLPVPVRAIESACQTLLTSDLASDSPAHQAVSAIAQETGHLKAMLKGVVEYIRLDTHAPAHAAIDSNTIIDAVRAAYETDIHTAHARITADIAPPVLGHRGRLMRLFSYLLENALLFRGAQPPVIHIGARQVNDMVEFTFTDNGIGFEEDNQDIIFILFQRLHTAEAYPGYGLGLALARKIVQSHGGKIWAESTLDTGSCFHFTLPAATHAGEALCN